MCLCWFLTSISNDSHATDFTVRAAHCCASKGSGANFGEGNEILFGSITLESLGDLLISNDFRFVSWLCPKASLPMSRLSARADRGFHVTGSWKQVKRTWHLGTCHPERLAWQTKPRVKMHLFRTKNMNPDKPAAQLIQVF